MHNAQDFVQILYFAGGVCIINENVYYCHIFIFYVNRNISNIWSITSLFSSLTPNYSVLHLETFRVSGGGNKLVIVLTASNYVYNVVV
jgi:hypothetical protein